MTTFSYTIYKNEFAINTIAFIRFKFKVTEETLKTITILATEEETEKIASLMYAGEDKLKEVFPEYITKAEAEEEAKKIKKEAIDQIREILLKYSQTPVIKTHGWSKEMQDLYDLWDKYTNE